jgi:hypothetical protein
MRRQIASGLWVTCLLLSCQRTHIEAISPGVVVDASGIHMRRTLRIANPPQPLAPV